MSQRKNIITFTLHFYLAWVVIHFKSYINKIWVVIHSLSVSYLVTCAYNWDYCDSTRILIYQFRAGYAETSRARKSGLYRIELVKNQHSSDGWGSAVPSKTSWAPLLRGPPLFSLPLSLPSSAIIEALKLHHMRLTLWESAHSLSRLSSLLGSSSRSSLVPIDAHIRAPSQSHTLSPSHASLPLSPPPFP